MSHEEKVLEFVNVPNTREKPLANRPMLGKPNAVINSINPCRKRTELSKVKIKRHRKQAVRPET